jgi:signal transduction histidine kinase
MGRLVRFDDSLKTVLAADSSTAFGAQAMFRQLVDLLARGRVAADDETLGRLRALRGQVPADVRAAAARGLALARPPVGLIEIFTEDEPAIASAALRSVRLPAADWVSLLPRLHPAGRAVLRRREDLDPVVVRALESFGSTDFALGYDAPPVVDRPVPPPVGPSPFIPVGTITDALPVVAAARRAAASPPPAREPNGFKIAELVDRIATFQRDRGTPAAVTAPPRPVESFRFEAGSDGAIRWADATPRGAVVGLSLATAAGPDAQVDGVVTGAFRRRTGFTDARLSIGGESALAGEWRISAVPTFDAATGRFTGYRGGARRPRADESAVRGTGRGRSEGLRRLVHELRTPTNAIAGFSELIEAQLLGPVSEVYRERAGAIRTQAADLIAAIEDLDLAARIEGDALELRPGIVPVAPLLERVVSELQALAGLRGCAIVVAPIEETLAFACDDRAAERLLARLLATVVSASQSDELIVVSAVRDNAAKRGTVTITRPQSLVGVSDTALLNLDAEREAELPGAPLLGTGFALRLVRNLAFELGGQLSILADRLTLALPAASVADMGQASTD